MHILDECKKKFEVECPKCGLSVRAKRISLWNNNNATVVYHCPRHKSFSKKIVLEVGVDVIGE